MVRLDRITMQGFKSFAHKITIPFPQGFNCVAGPNGSGKSNIIDAIMFVLGTTSARSIRAQKLQNLVFNGARDRTPADYCEVSLYIDNSDGAIPGEEKEVKLTRRVTRSGISMYKVSGKSVTRTRVLDLIANAHLSAEGYNIIMQGDVTNIIEMSPKERRGIIDEISGIAEFDEKRAKATTELEKVDVRVRENMIVVVEKQRLVQRMRQEKEAAEKYQRLSSELRTAKASLIHTKAGEATKKLTLLDKEIADEMHTLTGLEKSFVVLEKTLEEKEKSVQQKGNEVIKKSRNYEILRKIESLHSEVVRAQGRAELAEQELRRFANPVVQEILSLGLPDVHGTVASLIDVPKKYATAIEVALGRHRSDLVVDTDDIATHCIKHLKHKQAGMARFLPLNRIERRKRRHCKDKVIGYALDLITFDKQFLPALEYLLENTLVVEGIDEAKRIYGFRVVTLDGDLIEKSGAMIGGFYRRRAGEQREREFAQQAHVLRGEIAAKEKELEALRSLEREESEEVMRLQEERGADQQALDTIRADWRKIFEERQLLQNSISKKRIEKARVEAQLDNLVLEKEEFKDITEFTARSPEELQEQVRRCLIEINRLGAVNLKALEEYGIMNVEFEELKKKLDKLLEEKDAITKIVQEVEKKRHDKFAATLSEITTRFARIYHDLSGGTGGLRLEIEGDIDSGLVIEASPSGKRVLNLDSMSGGEKTLASLGFLFSIMEFHGAPFYILDEVDAALDKANTKKIVDLIKKYSGERQFIVISHNDFTVQEADKVFGVSMENGVSRVFGIALPVENEQE